MKRFIGLILLVIICLGLYTTNPTRDNFKGFIEESIRKEFNIGNSDDSILTSFLSSVTASITGKAASSMATRDDYYLFSIYSINIADEKVKFIGIFNRFLPLEFPKKISSQPDV